jgi:hypothetical protein
MNVCLIPGGKPSISGSALTESQASFIDLKAT